MLFASKGCMAFYFKNEAFIYEFISVFIKLVISDISQIDHSGQI